MQIRRKILDQLTRLLSNTVFKLHTFIVLLLGFGFLFSPIIAHADYSASWWNGYQCDSTNYSMGGHTSQLLTTWSGLQTCGYGPDQSPYNWDDVDEYIPNGQYHEGEWECTELVKRYLYLAFGVPSLDMTNGDQVVAHYASTYPSIFRSVSNTDGNSNHIWPKVGDVLSYSDVHTAIITGVTVTDATNGNATLNLIEQNASLSGTSTQQFTSWVIKGTIDDPNDAGSDTVTAWLTPRSWSVQSSPNPGSYNQLQGVTSSASNDAWAVGYTYNSGFYPVATHWNGSSWGSNAISGYSGDFLQGVSAISSSNILAVGYNSASVAFHYDGSSSSWSSIPTDNPGSGAVLMGVGSDSSGDAWAVGNTNGGNILLEKYYGSTTGFKNWTLTASDSAGTSVINNISGTSDNELNAVTVNSANDAWAVGFYYDGSGHKQPLTYYWDGTSWIQKLVTSPSGSLGTQLNGVTEIASNNVWAVGSSYNSSGTSRVTYTIHWDGYSWTTVASPSPSPTNDDNLYAISSISKNEVYAVGTTRGPTGAQYNNPLVLRYDGNQWVQESAPSAGINTSLSGVTVTATGTDPGEAYSVGYTGSGNTVIDQLY